MATFTIELREILAQGIDIGLQDYPIFSEQYRTELNKKIADHFKYREIGFETVDMFIDRINERMRLVMPYYNKVYESTMMEYDPLLTMRVVTDSESTGTETASTSAEANSNAEQSSDTGSKSRAVSSDFPLSQLQENTDYATSSSDSVANTEVASTATENSGTMSDTAAERAAQARSVTEGFQGPLSELVLRYRDTLINVDLAVMAELEPMFMQLWNTGDEYGDYPMWPTFYHPWGIY